MRTADFDFMQYINRDDKRVVFFVTFTAAGFLVTTPIQRYASRITSEMSNSISINWFDGLVGVNLASSVSDFFDPSVTNGRFSFTLSKTVVAENGTSVEVVDHIKNTFLFSSDAHIFMGFEELDPASYIEIAQGKVSDYQYANGLWTFVLSDTNRIFSAPIVNLPKSSCDGLQSSFGNIAKIDDGTPFIDQASLISDLADLGVIVLIRIDNELIKYSELHVVASNFFTVTERGAYGTMAVEHSDGTPILQVLAFEMRPSQFMLHAMLSGDDVDSIYNLSIPFFGMNIPENFVRHEDFEDFDHSYSMHEGALPDRPIILDEDVSNGREYMEENFLRPAGASFFISSGVVTVRNLCWGAYAGFPAIKPNPVKTQIILNAGQAFENTINNRDFFSNHFQLLFKKSVVEDRQSLRVYTQDESYGAFQRTKLLSLNYGSVVDDGTFNGGLHAISVNRGRWGKYYAQPALVEVAATFDNILLEPGDEVLLSDDNLPRLASGNFGLFNERLILNGTSLQFSNSGVARMQLNGYLFEAWRLIPNDVIFSSVGELNITAPNATLNSDKTGTFGADDAFTTTITTDWHLAIFELELNHAGGGADARNFIQLQAGALIPSTTTFRAREDLFRFFFNPFFAITNRRIFLYLFSTSDHIQQSLNPITGDCQFKVDYWFSTTTEGNSPTIVLRDVHLVEFTDALSIPL